MSWASLSIEESHILAGKIPEETGIIHGMGEGMNGNSSIIAARGCGAAEQSERPHQGDDHCHNQQGDRHQPGPVLEIVPGLI